MYLSRWEIITLKIAALVFLLLAGLALEASGAEGSSDVPMQEIDAGEILAKVQKGQPVEYDHVVVRGDLDLSRERLQKNINTPIWISNSIFSGQVSFNGTTLEKWVDMSGSNFTNDIYLNEAAFSDSAHFKNAAFSGDANFEGVTFSDDAYFKNAVFSGDANFEGVTFSDDAYFKNAVFSGDANFERATFRRDASFGEGAFRGGAYFEKANFRGDAYFTKAAFSIGTYFDEAAFSGDAHFTVSAFSDDVYFEKAAFSGNAGFVGVAFKGGAYFWKAAFSGDADFFKAAFSGIAYFQSATFTGNSSFEKAEFSGNVEFGDARFENYTSFYRTLFNRPAYFENSNIKILNLTKADFSRLHLRWKGIVSLHFDEAVYLALIKNYYNLGWYGDANRCYYDYRNAVREDWLAPSSGFAARLSNLLDWFVDFMEWLLYGYGVRPSFPIAWSSLIILAFSIFFWRKRCLQKIIVAERIEDSKDASDEVQIKTTARKAEIGALDPILFSLFTFTSGFTAFLHPTIEYKLERCVRWAIFERLLGPFFMALVITAISKTYLIR
jgi:hypothetical protein